MGRRKERRGREGDRVGWMAYERKEGEGVDGWEAAFDKVEEGWKKHDKTKKQKHTGKEGGQIAWLNGMRARKGDKTGPNVSPHLISLFLPSLPLPPPCLPLPWHGFHK